MSNTTHLTVGDLRHLKALLLDLRFLQACALTAAGVAEDKRSIEYMKSITRMEKLLEFELKDRFA